MDTGETESKLAPFPMHGACASIATRAPGKTATYLLVPASARPICKCILSDRVLKWPLCRYTWGVGQVGHETADVLLHCSCPIKSYLGHTR